MGCCVSQPAKNKQRYVKFELISNGDPDEEERKDVISNHIKGSDDDKVEIKEKTIKQDLVVLIMGHLVQRPSSEPTRDSSELLLQCMYDCLSKYDGEFDLLKCVRNTPSEECDARRLSGRHCLVNSQDFTQWLSKQEEQLRRRVLVVDLHLFQDAHESCWGEHTEQDGTSLSDMVLVDTMVKPSKRLINLKKRIEKKANTTVSVVRPELSLSFANNIVFMEFNDTLSEKQFADLCRPTSKWIRDRVVKRSQRVKN